MHIHQSDAILQEVQLTDSLADILPDPPLCPCENHASHELLPVNA